MKALVESGTRYYNTYRFAQEMQYANQRIRLLHTLSNPLGSLNAKISDTLTQFAVDNLVKNTWFQRKVVEHITDKVMNNPSRAVAALDLAHTRLQRTGHLFKKISRYDPTQVIDAVSLLCHDMALNLRDGKRIIQVAHAFNCVFQKTQDIANEIIENSIRKWNGTKQDQCADALEQHTLSIQTKNAEEGLLTQIGKNVLWGFSNVANPAALIFTCGYYAVRALGVGMNMITSNFAFRGYQEPQKAVVKAGVNSAINALAKKAIRFPIKLGIDILTFYLYHKGIRSLFVAETEDNPTWGFAKTAIDVGICAMACIYYGTSIYRWKKERERNILITNCAGVMVSPALFSENIDDLVNVLRDNLSGYFDSSPDGFKIEGKERETILSEFLRRSRELISKELVEL